MSKKLVGNGMLAITGSGEPAGEVTLQYILEQPENICTIHMRYTLDILLAIVGSLMVIFGVGKCRRLQSVTLCHGFFACVPTCET
jgi:hypothetical protein